MERPLKRPTFPVALAVGALAAGACVTTTPDGPDGSPGGSSSSSGGDAGGGPGLGDATTPSDGASGSSSSGGGATDGGPASGSPSWNNVAIGGGGFVTGIVFSPAQSGLAYARTDVGGLYRWNDTAAAWTPLTDGFSAAQGNYLGGESIAPDPVDPNVVYAAAGMYLTSGNGAILRSADQGNTWTVNTIGVAMGGNNPGRGMGERLAVDPNNPAVLFFGSRSNGLYTSTNSAATWAPVASFPTMGDATYGLPVIVFDKSSAGASGSSTIYVAAAAAKTAGTNLYKTTDGGATWAVVPNGPAGATAGPTNLMVHHAAMAGDGTLWLAYSGDYGPNNITGATLVGQIWKYATATGAWTNVTPTTNWGGMAGGLSVDAQDPQHVIVSTLDWYAPDRVLATNNGGTAWQVIAQPPINGNARGSTYDVQGAQYWMSGGANIGTGATNWVEALALDPFLSTRAMYGTGAGVWTSTNIGSATGANGQGVTWSFLDKGLEETVPTSLMPTVDGAFLGAIGDLGGMRNASLDLYSTTGEYANPLDSRTSGIDFAASNPNFVVRVGSSGQIASDVAYSNDNGQTWKPCATAATGYTTANEMGSVAVAADGSAFVVAPARNFGVPARTTNNGASWTAVTGLPTGAVVASDRVMASTFYATAQGMLYVSIDGGATFASANTFTGNGAPRPVFGQAGEVWVASTGGFYQFTDFGATKTTVTTATKANGVGFGMAAPGMSHPAVFIIGTVAGQYGFFRSDDGAGATWTRFNDTAHQFGALQGNFIAGDKNVYGRAYLTTGGRGFVYYDMP
jgi:hypothetical protein